MHMNLLAYYLCIYVLFYDCHDCYCTREGSSHIIGDVLTIFLLPARFVLKLRFITDLNSHSLVASRDLRQEEWTRGI